MRPEPTDPCRALLLASRSEDFTAALAAVLGAELGPQVLLVLPFTEARQQHRAKLRWREVRAWPETAAAILGGAAARSELSRGLLPVLCSLERNTASELRQLEASDLRSAGADLRRLLGVGYVVAGSLSPAGARSVALCMGWSQAPRLAPAKALNRRWLPVASALFATFRRRGTPGAQARAWSNELRLPNLDGTNGRERRIAALVSLGHTNKEIGELLALSPNTVRNHLAVLFSKLGVRNRSELVRRVIRGDP